MADTKHKLPGVRLEHRGSRIFERAGQKNVEMTVIAQVHDEKVWEEVEKKFISGFDVYTIEDFKGEMLQALRSENVSLETQLRVAQVELEKVRRENQLLETELDGLRRPFIELGRRLEGGE